MVLKKGSKGKEVKELQEFLGITVDGDFGPKTESAVMIFQRKHGLYADGIVGSNTWDVIGLATTDNKEIFYETSNGLTIERYYLPKGEYKEGPTDKEYLFLHHTAGWHNPYNQIDQWGRDSRGSIGTEFVLGGPSIKGNDFNYDGKMLQCIPEGGYGWHLGKNGSQHMHTHSVGIEICNFGYIENGKTYARTSVVPEQIVKLDKPFRGHQEWHRYSDEQIEATRKLILFIAERDGIDVREGLISEIKKKGVDAFEFNEGAYYGKVKGMWSHSNTRKDKTDLFPQQELIDMLLSL